MNLNKLQLRRKPSLQSHLFWAIVIALGIAESVWHLVTHYSQGFSWGRVFDDVVTVVLVWMLARCLSAVIRKEYTR